MEATSKYRAAGDQGRDWGYEYWVDVKKIRTLASKTSVTCTLSKCSLHLLQIQ
jgi:hypothetical protein